LDLFKNGTLPCDVSDGYHSLVALNDELSDGQSPDAVGIACSFASISDLTKTIECSALEFFKDIRSK
jgi:hypothetical protein